jgi:hypothetical protein
MLQKLQADAEKIRKQIEQIAVSQRVSLHFSSARGRKVQLIMNRTAELNMVLIPAAYSSSGTTKPPHYKQQLAVVYDTDNPSCDNALNIALSQAEKHGYELFVIVDSQASCQHVEQQTKDYQGHVNCRIVDFTDAKETLLLLQKHSPELLVLTENSRLINNEQLFQQLINTVETDILLVH